MKIPKNLFKASLSALAISIIPFMANKNLKMLLTNFIIIFIFFILISFFVDVFFRILEKNLNKNSK